jgi:hypothetical protein
MVRAWVALAAGKRRARFFLQHDDGNATAAKLNGEDQPARASSYDDDGAIEHHIHGAASLQALSRAVIIRIKPISYPRWE